MIDEFFDFIKRGTCPFTVVEEAVKELQSKGFTELCMKKEWQIEQGKKYFVKVYDSTLIAFSVGRKFGYYDRICIAAAHTDQPCFVIKPNPVMKSGKYVKIDVESYGGAVLNTWLDRPLGLAGCVVSRTKDMFAPKITVVDSKEPVMVIPNLAIHFNRDVNKGIELNKQKDMIPLAGIVEEELGKKDFLINYLSEISGVTCEDILDYQLYLYNAQECTYSGLKKDIILAPRIDNLASVFACLKGIGQETNEKNLNMIALFDHEEVGSRTKQGAASDILYRVLQRIYESMGRSLENLEGRLGDGIFLSLDGAHAVHPNQPDKYDPANPVYLNDGIVIKKSASQSYATDAYASAVVKDLCHKNHILYREFVNKSDIPGGSTLGAIASTKVPMRMADVGVPMLAMHSAMESMGTKDLSALIKLVSAFFTE
ncbi:MAG: M18 family aminopeptidase [Thermoflexaceae bacterium]|nr:M18 family aminopeptidase [Thermoflexaceae bacterium]